MRSNASMRERATVDRRWSRVCAYENAISLNAVVRKAFGVRLAKTGRLLQLRDQVRQLFVSLAARRDRRTKKSLRSLRFLHRLPGGAGRVSRTADAFGILHDGAAVHEERTADGCEHPLGRARDEGDEQAVVAQVGNRLSTALDRVRMACCRVAQRRDAAHDERSARVLGSPQLGLSFACTVISSRFVTGSSRRALSGSIARTRTCSCPSPCRGTARGRPMRSSRRT